MVIRPIWGRLWRRFLSLVFCMAVWSSPLLANEQTQSPISKADVGEPDCLIRTVFGSWKPYQYYNDKGKLTGSHVRFLRHIGKQIGCQLEFIEMNFADSLLAINTGQVDMASHVTRTAKRESLGQFSIPYTQDYFALYIDPDDVALYGSKSLEQLLEGGFRLGITDKFYYGKTFEVLKNNPRYAEQVIKVDDSYENYHSLFLDQIDGFLENPLIAAYTIREQKLGSKLTRHSSTYYGNYVSFLFSNQVPQATIDQFNRVLEQMITEPDYSLKWSYRL